MFEDAMPLWSASRMFEAGLIDAETAAQASEPWGNPLPAPPMEASSYFDDDFVNFAELELAA